MYRERRAATGRVLLASRDAASLRRVANSRPEAAPSASAPPGAPPDLERLTPAMRQYWEQKQQAPDALLLFRMGDFYELFYDDAERGARLLGITLTSRDGGKTPLAGIPHHALESYLGKLVAAGCKVAISEQVEDAKQAKGVVRREVVRVVTPGTLTDESLLEHGRSNLLLAICPAGDGETADVGVAAVELSTGLFSVATVPAGRVCDELGRLGPAEVLVAENVAFRREGLVARLRERVDAPLTLRSPTDFGAVRAGELLRKHFETATLEGFGFEQVDPSLQAAGALLAYLVETQKTTVRHLQPPRRIKAGEALELDPGTLRSLEIERTIRGNSRNGSLLAAVDRTSTAMGARLLRQWICFPLQDVAQIERRQALIERLRGDEAVRTGLRAALRDIGDLERIVGRLGVERVHPRDLRALGDGLAQLASVRELAERLHHPAADALARDLDGLDELAARLCTALRAEAPTTLREGGIFNDGENAELDRLRAIGSDGQQWLAEFQRSESERTGIPLKVGYNKVFGYYIEITHAHRDRAPADYVRKQTVKNAERYITDALKQYEHEALGAESRAQELEYELFCGLRDEAAGHIPALQRAAAALAQLDVLVGWALLSLERGYCRPQFGDNGALEIVGGRHPVVEQTLAERFVPNDTALTAGGASLALITGPNMAGKSTYIRQVALLALLAHTGCWVPAERMRLGVVDRIFTRVGASDELSRGQSTFMVEMLETANILHNATARSLVVLDEVGRGTSTFDGVALAWAITEHLATRSGCRTLFATHYHELTEIADLLSAVFNLNVAVKEFDDRIVFLHRIVSGPADRSYGLHVAKLAGVPGTVLERANAVLNELEKTFDREARRPVLAAVQRRRQRQLRLFEEPEEQVVRELRELDLAGSDADAVLARLRVWRSLLGVRENAAADDTGDAT